MQKIIRDAGFCLHVIEQVGLLGLVEREVGQDAALLLDVLDVLFGVVATVLEMRVLPGWRGVAGYVGHDGPP